MGNPFQNKFGSFAANVINCTNTMNPAAQVFVIGCGLAGACKIKVTRRKDSRTTSDAKFLHPQEDYEFALERMQKAEERIEAVQSLLKEITKECWETKSELQVVVSEKNAVERMLEELSKAKKEAERATKELKKSVNVLTNELEQEKGRHNEKVQRWRNELVCYREKTQKDFLAEIIGLVADMDNDIQIEMCVPNTSSSKLLLPHERSQVRLYEESDDFGTRFALEDSVRLSVLAHCGKSATEMKKIHEETMNTKLSNSKKKVSSPAHAKKVATPTRKAFARLTNNQVTQNIEKIVLATTMKPKPPPSSSKLITTSPDANASNREFGDMLYFDASSSSSKTIVTEKVGKLSAAKASFLAKMPTFNGSKAVAETAFGVTDVKRAFKIDGYEAIEYVSPSRRKDLSIVR